MHMNVLKDILNLIYTSLTAFYDIESWLQVVNTFFVVEFGIKLLNKVSELVGSVTRHIALV
jgi:hypothetical protein